LVKSIKKFFTATTILYTTAQSTLSINCCS